jgi:manganese/zinc/iron transport system permease protein
MSEGLSLWNWGFFKHDFVQILILILLAFNCGLLGPFLVLRRQTMLANSISHTVLLGIAAAFWLEHWTSSLPLDPFIITMLCSAWIAWLTGYITQKVEFVLKVQTDASIGLVFSFLFALGVIAVSACFSHSHVGLEIIMGNADALVSADIYPVALALGINLVLIKLLFKEYTLSSFDRSLSQAMGFSTKTLDYLLMMQISLTMMVGFRAVGAFLMMSFLIGPFLCARFLSCNLRSIVILSAFFAAVSGLTACILARFFLQSYQIALSTAGLSSTLLFAFFCILWTFSTLKSFNRKRSF